MFRYTRICVCVQKMTRLAAGVLHRLRGWARYSTLRHYARYTLDNMVFVLNVQFISSSRIAHGKPNAVFPGTPATVSRGRNVIRARTFLFLFFFFISGALFCRLALQQQSSV